MSLVLTVIVLKRYAFHSGFLHVYDCWPLCYESDPDLSRLCFIIDMSSVCCDSLNQDMICCCFPNTHRYTKSCHVRQQILAKDIQYTPRNMHAVFCFAVLCCGYTLTDFPISITLTSLALWQSNDCPSAGKATLMNMDKYFMWIHYERLHNHNKAKHNKTVCIFLGIYCTISGKDKLAVDVIFA